MFRLCRKLENYGYIAQDTVQTYHWNNSYATLHPFVVYYKDEENQQMKAINYCVLSDCLKHNASTVHSVQYVDLQNLRTFAKFKVLHLNYHYMDYELKAEWQFFATSHGKSASGGIGGTVKRLLARTSL